MPEIEEYIEVARQMAPLFVAAAIVVSVILGLMNRLSESKEEAPVPLILQQAAAAQAAKEKKKKAKEAEEEAKRLKKKKAAAAAASKVKLADRPEVASVLKGAFAVHTIVFLYCSSGKERSGRKTALLYTF